MGISARDHCSINQSSRTVRVKLPVAVANDLKKFQIVQKDILGRLGCLACCSGWDIRWEIENTFLVDEKLKITGGF